MIKFKDINRSKMAEQKTEEELEYNECYRLNNSKLIDILTQIKEKGKETNTYFELLKDGIYIYGKLNLFKSGEGGKETSSYVGRLINGSLINKRDSLYLQIRNIYEYYDKTKWKVSYTNPNLVAILRQFIV